MCSAGGCFGVRPLTHSQCTVDDAADGVGPLALQEASVVSVDHADPHLAIAYLSIETMNSLTF